jgi:hypothetical protein
MSTKMRRRPRVNRVHEVACRLRGQGQPKLGQTLIVDADNDNLTAGVVLSNEIARSCASAPSSGVTCIYQARRSGDQVAQSSRPRRPFPAPLPPNRVHDASNLPM